MCYRIAVISLLVTSGILHSVSAKGPPGTNGSEIPLPSSCCSLCLSLSQQQWVAEIQKEYRTRSNAVMNFLMYKVKLAAHKLRPTLNGHKMILTIYTEMLIFEGLNLTLRKWINKTTWCIKASSRSLYSVEHDDISKQRQERSWLRLNLFHLHF